jgi:alpha-galactosidase
MLTSPPARKFPSGMKSISDRIHTLGFKFGMYSSAGTFTCGKFLGSLDHETQDAQSWAEWGVDYLKYDNCFNQGRSGTPKLSFDRFKVMSDALNATGREIVYGMCNWGNDDPYDWAYDIANSGRMSGDIYDSFNRPDARCPCTESIGCAWPGFHCSVMNILNKMPAITSRTMSGYFNDMDMLEVGNGGQSDSEYVVHFSMWAINSSPMLIGTSIQNLSPANLAIYSNSAIIAINQDKSAGAAKRVWRYFTDPDDNGEGEVSLWTRSLSNGDRIVALLNAANKTMSMNYTMDEVFFDERTAGAYKAPPEVSQTWDVYDLWANRMSETEAAAILNGTTGEISSNSTTRFNATAMSYMDGVKNGHAALMGKQVGTLMPSGTFSAEIARHSVGVCRLRSRDNSSKNKDEL